MNDIFSEQKEKLIAINQEISLLRQQISYLLRNDKPLGLLDLDVLMNRTHTVYDMLCAIHLGDQADEEEIDFDPEAFLGLFGDNKQETPQETEETTKVEIAEEDQTIAEELLSSEELDEHEEMVEEVAEAEETALEPVEAPFEEPEPMEEPIEEEPVETPVVEPQPEVLQKQEQFPESDAFDLFFRFEDEPVVEEKVSGPVLTEDGKLVHFVEEVPEEEIPARDLVDGDSLTRENPFDMPRMEDGSEEPDFELASSETLAESLMHEDHSLAARLQQNPVSDLKSAIGINDKFLFVNELFGGSMEKYNKSIENLNDLKTLNGAMIYLNELKIELQWNNSNDAYQKLAELVRRKFE